MKLLSAQDIQAIHEKVIDPNELQGLAGDKSLDAVLSRVENRIQYGLITDVYDLAATYAAVIAVGHVFNDANKRTAFITMDACLRENGITLEYDTESIGQTIIKVAQSKMDEVEQARYLRN
uniref:Death-on-curing protein n=1 Tax=uncultured Thiotrichaceae bacterium TaxID=298394 RepID=A0A6S6SEB0_9GAMM|nr:MAG: Death-on-curing protein [uncultured Thiotrichaceae bacterium]